MLAYLIIMIKILSLVFLEKITMIDVSAILPLNQLELSMQYLWAAFPPTSLIACGAYAYDERYIIFATILFLIIFIIWSVLLISMILSLFLKRTRLFTVKLSCFVLFIDVISSFFCSDVRLRVNCIVINGIFLLLSLVSLLIANRKFKKN